MIRIEHIEDNFYGRAENDPKAKRYFQASARKKAQSFTARRKEESVFVQETEQIKYDF